MEIIQAKESTLIAERRKFKRMVLVAAEVAYENLSKVQRVKFFKQRNLARYQGA